MKLRGWVLGAVVWLGCGEAGYPIDVTLVHSDMVGLDPYDPQVGLVRVRIRADGEEALDASAVDVPRDARSGQIVDYPTRDSVRIVAEGYDERGNIVAFGEERFVRVAEATSVNIALRRNLGYVTHGPDPATARAASRLYVFDLVSRSRVTTVGIPGTAPVARRITARGGTAFLVSYLDGGQGFVGMLDAATHGWRTISLSDPPDIALGTPNRSIGVAVGGGAVTFLDLQGASVAGVFGERIGGRVLDGAISADGSRALVAIDINPGLLMIDLEDLTVRSMDVVNQPSGIALAEDGRTAYVTSSADSTVVSVDLFNGRAEALGRFVRPVGEAAFSDVLAGVFALDSEGPFGIGRVLGFLTEGREALQLEQSVRTFNFPAGIAADGPGRRLLAVASGGATATAGVTLIDTAPNETPVGSSGDYPRDDTDFVMQGNFQVFRRYRPTGVAIVYGR